ncbi:desmoglein-3-like [Anomaloglossus baeobatrachus]|uniref:desmoglein-3-like n=1 Tax=Anomaloglossus baeobatrachus TaxID=238106 RepID=UPI003F5099DC
MDWKLCAPFSVLIILLICSQCSCHWNVQANKGKYEESQISDSNIYLKRQKREWVVPPTNMQEEEDNRYRNPIAKVHSDIETKKGIIRYRVSGQGVDLPPYGLFVIDPRTGHLNVTGVIVDREQISMLYLTVHAVSVSGEEVEKPLQLRVRVLDINDNPPIFHQSVFTGSVEENCKANTPVMQIIATDADEANTINSQIAYRIITQNPSDPSMFIMNQHTGQIFTMANLDRELVSSYSLVIGATDLNGGPGGLSGQCGADVKVLDVNDNFPMLEYDSYSVQIKENMVGFSDLRMKVFDLDEMYSDNWIAVFEIISGNEGGWFTIETDSQTNEGVLRVVQAMDYEAMQSANLAILVNNRAAFHSSVMSQYQAKVSSISVQVQNVREGPAFIPTSHFVQIPSGLSKEAMLQYVLAKIVAVDLDTGGPAKNVVYSLNKESSRWLIIDSTTGEIKMTYQMIDNIAKDNTNPNNPNNGKNFTATIFAEDTNDPTLTSSGTVAVGMSNPTPTPACPVVTQEPRVACLDRKEVIIRAVQDPLNAPLKITVAPNSDWNVLPYNDTAVILVGGPSVGARNSTVLVYATDNNNLTCPNAIPIGIQACECTAARSCDASKLSSKNVSLGPAAIGLMVLGFLALLLALLLLPLCVCGSAAATKFIPIAAGYDGAVHAWGTEGAKPEDVDMTCPFVTAGGPDYSEVNAGNFIQGVGAAGGSLSGTATAGGTRHASGTGIEMSHVQGDGFDGDGMRGFSGISNTANSFIGIMPPPYEKSGTLNMAYVENYFAEKAELYANEDESRPANDCLLIYDNEGMGSPAGSVGCCSFIADDLDDTFLDTLGPKFKTLAEICIGSEIEPVASGGEPRLFPNIPIIETEANMMLNESALSVPVNQPAAVRSATYVTESSMSSANLQPMRPMAETLMPGNVIVTETYTTSGGTMRPVIRNVDPVIPTNILVTERLVESTAPAARGVFSDLHNGSNVIVTERVVRPASGVHEFLEIPNITSISDASNVVLRERVAAPNNVRLSNSFNIPDIDLGDAQNVLVTERVIQPISNVQGNLSIRPEMGSSQNANVRLSNSFNFPDLDLGDAQNVLVTERVIQPISNVQGNLSIRPEMGSSQNLYVTEKTVRSGPAIKTQMLSAEPLRSQVMGSTSPSLTRSKVTKYSTVQYTKQ